MSEYEIVKFRAIDRPLSDKQLDFMEKQSSRAEFNQWEYEVDYKYSSFHGDVDGMLRNGYDLFLNYSNYGTREIRLRLPSGLPFPKAIWSKYLNRQSLTWASDKKGKGGILALHPFQEDIPEEIWDFDDYLDVVAKIRELLIEGDLRALYVMWLCCAMDSNEDYDNGETLEPPTPHGLSDFPKEAKYLLSFFALDPLLVDAAAMGIPSFNPQISQTDLATTWLSSVAPSRQTEILRRLVSEDPVALKSELLEEIRQNQPGTSWPVESPKRNINSLLETCDLLRQKKNEKKKRQAAAKAKREADKAEKQRQARMAEMKPAHEPWLEKASELVNAGGTINYREAASVLSDVREAIGGEQGDKIARKHAAHLAEKHPTLRMLKSSLRKQQLLD